MNLKWLSRSVVATMVALLVLFTELHYMTVPERVDFPLGITAIVVIVAGGLTGLGTAALGFPRLSHKTLHVMSVVAAVLVGLGAALALLSVILPHI